MNQVWRLAATRRAFTFLATSGSSNRFFINQTKRAGAQLFYADGGLTSTEDEKPVFHPTNGREAKTAILLFSLPVFPHVACRQLDSTSTWSFDALFFPFTLREFFREFNLFLI